MAKIPKTLQSHIDTAFPANVCLLGSVLPNGFAQVTPRGGTMVYDDEHIGLWERGSGSSALMCWRITELPEPSYGGLPVTM